MIIYLLASYGLCFGLQHKSPINLYGWSDVTDKLLKCTYCTGFHSGWFIYLAHLGIDGVGEAEMWQHFLTAAMWGFASSGLCMGLDILIQYLEYYTATLKLALEANQKALTPPKKKALTPKKT